MPRVFTILVVIVLLAIVGSSNSINNSEEGNDKIKTEVYYFTGTIKEVSGNAALISAKILKDNPEGDIFVDLSVNTDDKFEVGDKVKVGYDGMIMESNPAQINTLSIELVD